MVSKPNLGGDSIIFLYHGPPKANRVLPTTIAVTCAHIDPISTLTPHLEKGLS